MNNGALSWNPELGLCRQAQPGHTAPVAGLPAVHNGVISAFHLCGLAQAGQLAEITALTTLRSLRAMQQPPGGEQAGCLRWYWEESGPVDTNASFFIGLALELLYLAEADKLGDPVRAAIREIIAGLAAWYEHELSADPRYPNKCLGDLVCGWLAAEVLEREPSARLVHTSRAWSDYWRDTHWGWGEHLSDIYSGVLLIELSALLLYCRHLPDDLQRRCRGHLTELLRIEDGYDGGPRVPVIRSYAFAEPPVPRPFRGWVRPPVADNGPPSLGNRHPAEVFGPWFQRAGWHRLAPAAAPPADWMETPCHGGAVARAVRRPSLRLGAMSRYPVMEDVDHQTWGLSWQTFPAALWSASGDWAFWRWTTHEGNRVRAHPALDLAGAYLGNALSSRLEPPPVPRMISELTRHGRLTMTRILPLPSDTGWDVVEDEFRLLHTTAQVYAAGNRLTLRWPDATATVCWLGEANVRWEPAADGGRWVVRRSAAQLAGCTQLTHRWTLELG